MNRRNIFAIIAAAVPSVFLARASKAVEPLIILPRPPAPPIDPTIILPRPPKAEWFLNADDPENGHMCPYEILSDEPYGVVEIHGAAVVEKSYWAYGVTETHAEGEWVEFTSNEEALAFHNDPRNVEIRSVYRYR